MPTINQRNLGPINLTNVAHEQQPDYKVVFPVPIFVYASKDERFGGAGYQECGLLWLRVWRSDYVVTDADKRDVDAERDASEFDSGFYRKLLEKAWGEAAFVIS